MSDIPDYPDDFTNYPLSITARKAEQKSAMQEWTPRDVLIDVLRSIDSGETNAAALIVAWREQAEGGNTRTRFCQCGPNVYVTIGLIELAKDKILHND